jgi:hypothetical protein
VAPARPYTDLHKSSNWRDSVVGYNTISKYFDCLYECESIFSKAEISNLENLKIEVRADLKRDAYFAQRENKILHDEMRVIDASNFAFQHWLFPSRFVEDALLLSSLSETLLARGLVSLARDLLDVYFMRAKQANYWGLESLPIRHERISTATTRTQFEEAARALIVGHEIGHFLSYRSEGSRSVIKLIAHPKIRPLLSALEESFSESNLVRELESDFWAIELLYEFSENFHIIRVGDNDSGAPTLWSIDGLDLAYQQFTDIILGLLITDVARCFLAHKHNREIKTLRYYLLKCRLRFNIFSLLFFRRLASQAVGRTLKIGSRRYELAELSDGQFLDSAFRFSLRPLVRIIRFLEWHAVERFDAWNRFHNVADLKEMWKLCETLSTCVEAGLSEAGLKKFRAGHFYLPVRADDPTYCHWSAEEREHIEPPVEPRRYQGPLRPGRDLLHLPRGSRMSYLFRDREPPPNRQHKRERDDE